MQNIVTDGNGLKTPMKKLTMSVTEVIVMDTAASLIIFDILSETLSLIDVLLHAANITKVSSIPIPEKEELKVTLISFRSTAPTTDATLYKAALPIMRKGAAKLIPMKSTPKYMHSPKADNVAIVALTFPRSPSHGFDLTQSAIMQVTGSKPQWSAV